MAVSLDPPLVLVSIGKQARGHGLLGDGRSRSTCSAPSRRPWRGTSPGDPHPDGCTGRPEPSRRRSPARSRPSSAVPGARTTAATTRCSSARSSDFDYRGGDALGTSRAASRRSRSPRSASSTSCRERSADGSQNGPGVRRGAGRARDPRRDRGEQHTGNVSEIPQLRNVVRTYAELFDLQHDPALRDVMTYESPTTGDRVGMSFLQPQSVDDVVRRGDAMRVWAEYSLGNLGRTGDYCSSAVMAMAGAADWFGQADPAFAENVRRYYEHVRENDLLLTHTLVFPQANRSVGPSQQRDQTLAARIVDRERQRHRDPRRAHARDDRPVRGRDPRHAVDGAQGHRRRRAVLVRLRHPVRHAGAPLPLPRELRPRAQPLRPPARVAVRGDRRDRGLRRRPRPVGAVLRRRAARALQRDLLGDERRRRT